MEALSDHSSLAGRFWCNMHNEKKYFWQNISTRYVILWNIIHIQHHHPITLFLGGCIEYSLLHHCHVPMLINDSYTMCFYIVFKGFIFSATLYTVTSHTLRHTMSPTQWPNQNLKLKAGHEQCSYTDLPMRCKWFWRWYCSHWHSEWYHLTWSLYARITFL
jgi:hypothetical protein